MKDNSEINKLIIQTIESSCENPLAKNLIKNALQYELDIWNRGVMPSTIMDEYERLVEKAMKKEK